MMTSVGFWAASRHCTVGQLCICGWSAGLLSWDESLLGEEEIARSDRVCWGYSSSRCWYSFRWCLEGGWERSSATLLFGKYQSLKLIGELAGATYYYEDSINPSTFRLLTTAWTIQMGINFLLRRWIFRSFWAIGTNVTQIAVVDRQWPTYA